MDIESDRREEAIQYVYAKHGRRRAALVRQRHHLPRQVRDLRRREGPRLLAGQQDAWSKQIDRWGPVASVTCGGSELIPSWCSNRPAGKADALGAFARTRTVLVERFDLDSSPTLVEIQCQVLENDDRLAAARPH